MNGNGEKIPPRIEVSHFAGSKVHSMSEESLLKGNEELPGGVSNPIFNVEEPSSGVASPEPNRFSFDEESIQRFKAQPRRGTFAGGTTPSSRILISDGRKTAIDGSLGTTILVQDIHHTNSGINFTSDDFGDKINSYDSFPSDGRLPVPTTPGLLGINGYDRHPPPSPGLLSINSVWSELAKCNSRRSSYTESNESSFRSGSLSNLSSSLSEHLHNLVRAFSSRTERVKATTAVPPTPSSSPEIDANSDALSAISNLEEPPGRTHRLDSFIPGHKPTPTGEPEEQHHYLKCGCCKSNKISCKIPRVFEAQSKIYMTWLFLVTMTFMYNALAIPLRAAFTTRYMNKNTYFYWLTADYVGDLIYLLDILVFKPRLTYLTQGLIETDVKKTRKNYMRKSIFKFDMLSLIPLDLFYFVAGFYGPSSLLRFPRLMKIQTFWEFYQRCDQAVRSAHILRIIKTMTYMLFLIHIETCGYYAISAYEGFDTNEWVYNGQGNAYIRCFYLATKTATSIGNNPTPVNTLEYVFMIVYWLSGVFVFALLVGQIRDIVEQAQRIKTLYDKRMETALRYVKNLNLPKEMREKVRVWFLYNWQQQKILDERALMDTLPTKLRTDLAIHVHFNTLSRVKLFQDCDKSLLYNLVLKLNPILFLPGEYVCRKGEVGKEMYIVSQGLVEVVGGPNNSLVFATLKNGSVFGEISLLSVGTEGNRRTADVRVKGFTNLFILSKADFESAMSEFPTAHKMLKKRARKLLAQNAKMQKKESESSLGGSKINVEQIIHPPKEPNKTPKLFQTVLQVMNPGSNTAKKFGASHEDEEAKNHTNSDSDGSNEHPEININVIDDDGVEQEININDDDGQHGVLDIIEKTVTNEDDDNGCHELNNNADLGSQKVNPKVAEDEEEIINKDDIPGDDIRKDSTTDDLMKGEENKMEEKSMTAKEVEDFYDEILRATEGNPDTFEEAVIAAKNPLKRDGTANTEDSVDSGVHVNKPLSPTSSTQTVINKDIKDSATDVLIEDPVGQRNLSIEDPSGQQKVSIEDPSGQQKGIFALLADFFNNDTIKDKNSDTNRKGLKQNGSSKNISKPNQQETFKKQNDNTPKKGASKTNENGNNHKNSTRNDSDVKLTNTKPTAKEIKPIVKSTDANKAEKSPGLLSKPGSKRPNIMNLKPMVRRITPEIQITSDHVTKPNSSGKKQKPNVKSKKNESLLNSPIKKTHQENLNVNNETEELEQKISEILDNDSSKSVELIPNSHEKNDRRKPEEKDNYEPRILRIEASISSLSSEIEKADALLRDLCSDDEEDKALIHHDKIKESKLSENKNKVSDKKKEQNRNGTNLEKKMETYTIPAKNQITCSVEVHREKSLTPLDIHGDIITPISLTEWIENANESLRKRKESSTSSIFHETGV